MLLNLFNTSNITKEAVFNHSYIVFFLLEPGAAFFLLASSRLTSVSGIFYHRATFLLVDFPVQL